MQVPVELIAGDITQDQGGSASVSTDKPRDEGLTGVSRWCEELSGELKTGLRVPCCEHRSDGEGVHRSQHHRSIATSKGGVAIRRERCSIPPLLEERTRTTHIIHLFQFVRYSLSQLGALQGGCLANFSGIHPARTC